MLSNDPTCANGCATNTDPLCPPNQQFQQNCPTDDCNAVPDGWTYCPQDFLTPMAGKLQPAFRVFMQGHSAIMQFFFDYKQIPDSSGKVDFKLVFKNVDSVKLWDFYDGNYVTWGEWYYKQRDFVVAQDYAAPTLTLQVGTISGYDGAGLPIVTPTLVHQGCQTTSGITPMHTVLIYRTDPANPCCEQLIQKTVVTTNPGGSEMTLEPGFSGDAGFTFQKGDKVKILYKSRNDCCEIDNRFSESPSTAKRAYVQHFGYEICFNKCEINKAYATQGGAMDVIKNKIFHHNLGIVREMAMAAYLGRNRGWVCCGCDELPAETQGLITAIYDADARDPGLGLITSLHNALTDEDKIRHLLCELFKAQNSGILRPGETITWIVNEKAATAMMYWNKARCQFTCTTYNKSDGSDGSRSYAVNLPKIQTPNGSIEIVQDHLLSELYPNEWVILMVPRRLLSLTTRRNYKYDFLTGKMETNMLGFQMEEVTPFKQHECRCYDVWTEFAMIIAGADSGAYRMVMGIQGC